MRSAAGSIKLTADMNRLDTGGRFEEPSNLGSGTWMFVARGSSLCLTACTVTLRPGFGFSTGASSLE